jgi:ligand-binding SRPBCC domain-containing protein
MLCGTISRPNSGFPSPGAGVFQYFRHCHRVSDEVRDGVMGSVVSDAVEYELPLGLLGDVANGLAVRRQIRSLFHHRQKTLPGLLAAAKS